MDNNDEKSDSQKVWCTHDEIEFISGLGSHNVTMMTPRIHLLRSYLANMDSWNKRWIDGDTRIDPYQIKDAVKKQIIDMEATHHEKEI